ncbi:unnamed protein product, partial [Ectocarpus fasciculatus]
RNKHPWLARPDVVYVQTRFSVYFQECTLRSAPSRPIRLKGSTTASRQRLGVKRRTRERKEDRYLTMGTCMGIEGTHNEAALKEGRPAYKKIEHLDARLTDLGKEQCATLKAANHGIEKEAELVVVSPLTRAIQTAMLTIDQVEGVPWVAL